MSAFVTNKGGGQKLTVYTLDDCTVDNSAQISTATKL